MKHQIEHRTHIIDLNDLKSDLGPEQLGNIKEMSSSIELLWLSLNSREEGTLKSIYGRLIDEQQGKPQNLVLIDQLKVELMGAYVPHYTKLIQILNKSISEKFNNYFEALGIYLPALPEAMLEEITSLMTNRLPEKIEDNKFRLAVWLDKVGRAKDAINKLL